MREPAGPFLERVRGLAEGFPEHPPEYGVDGYVAHVTAVSRAPLALQDDVERGLVPPLPVSARADRVSLFERNFALRWDVRAEHPLEAALHPTLPLRSLVPPRA